MRRAFTDPSTVDGVPARQREQRRLVAWCAAAIVVLFAGQQAVTEAVREPFPALVFPSFVNDIEDDVVRKRTATLEVEFANGHRWPVGNGAFVAGVTARPFDLLNTMFWVNAELVDGRSFTATDPETIEFTRERLKAMFPNQDSTLLLVTWTKEATKLDGTPDPRRTRIVRTVHVDL